MLAPSGLDREVIRDRGLVTSRKPDDIPAFNREMIQLFAEETQGRHAESTYGTTASRKTA